MTAQFKLASVQKSYGDRLALYVEELTIWPGRVCLLTGPNGSGKSTLLNVLAFLVRPESGEITFAGQRVNWSRRELNVLRRNVTLLHQSPFLFTGTVFANVAFGLKVRSARGQELRRCVSESLDLVGLSGFEQRDVRRLSGGEARRVALARALAPSPRTLLLDEPLANLDGENAEIIERLIASLAAQGRTIVISTHNLQLGGLSGEDTIRLFEGRVESSAAYSYRPGQRDWEQEKIGQTVTAPAF